jgi:hypothetical protein
MGVSVVILEEFSSTEVIDSLLRLPLKMSFLRKQESITC